MSTALTIPVWHDGLPDDSSFFDATGAPELGKRISAGAVVLPQMVI